MADHPILFSAAMIQALLAGRKTQTRRIIKPAPKTFLVDEAPCEVALYFGDMEPWPRIRLGRVITTQKVRFRPGMRLWVRENCWTDYQGADGIGVRYPADGAWIKSTDDERWAALDCYAHNRHPDNATNTGQLVPSIHMPRWASRITLTVTGVRVQRLQDITEDDAVAEGIACEKVITGVHCYGGPPIETYEDRYFFDGCPDEGFEDGVTAYAALWNHLHGTGAWDANPDVVALTFTVRQGNIDREGT